MDPTSSRNICRRVTWGATERRLLARAREGTDRQALEELLQHLLPFARELARRYRRWPEPLDDLQQVASLALFRALQQFDPAGGLDFPAFALPAILEDLASYRLDADEASSERAVFNSEPSYGE
jgi:DNA-directed RNA polymerase specialized sigma subunit